MIEPERPRALASEDGDDRSRARRTARAENTRRAGPIDGDAVFTLANDGRVTSWNVAALALFGYEEKEIVGRSHGVLFAPSERQAGAPETVLHEAREAGTVTVEGKRLRKDGTPVWCCETLVPLRGPDGEVLGFTKVSRDSAGPRATLDELRRSEERLRSLLAAVPDYALFSVDTGGKISIWSPGAEHVFGYTENDVLKKHFSLLYPGEEIAGGTPRRLLADARRSGRASGESWHVRKNGERFYAAVQLIRLAPDAAGRPRGCAAIVRDVTVHDEAEETIERRAFYDGLTRLPNRSFFVESLRRAIACVKREPAKRCAVIFMDIDRFKLLNDSLGHAAGDALLVGLARILERCLRLGDIVARLGGDEFTILLSASETAVEAAELVAKRIAAALAEPLPLDGFTAIASVSMGIAIVSAEYDNPEQVLRDADVAMYEAKARGRAQHVVFDAMQRSGAGAASSRPADIVRALERREFFLEYEPLVALQTRRAVGFEALVRWKHPEHGTVLAQEFFEEAKRSGSIARIERWAVREACRQLRDWRARSGDAALTICVKFSESAFADEGLVLELTGALDAHGLRPRNLKLEVTEAALRSDSEARLRTFERLRRIGIELYVGDYGSGHSSLGRLAEFPLGALKIGAALVDGSSAQTIGAEMPRAIVALANHLGLRAVADGVETEEQYLRFKEFGCEEAQGRWFAAPAAASDARRLIGVRLPV